MRIAVFLSTREDVVTFSPIYWVLRRLGHRVYLYDLGVEAGWFEKGLQYLSLDYDRLSGRFDKDIPEDILKAELERMIEKTDYDYFMFMGYSEVLLPYLRFCYDYGIKTIHIGSGLRRYDSSETDLVYQLVDRYSMVNLTYSPMHTGNLVSEGFDPTRVVLIGYPLIDLVEAKVGEALNKSTILDEIGVGEGEYVLIILWRRGSYRYIDELSRFSETTGEYLVCPTPKWGKRLLMGMDKYYTIMERHDITFLESMDILDHLALIMGAKSVLTDAEWIYIESLILRKPGVLMLEEGDRPLILREDDVNYVFFGEGLADEVARRYMEMSRVNVRRLMDTSLMKERIMDVLDRFENRFVRNEVRLFGYKDDRLVELDRAADIPYSIRRFLP